MRPNAGQIQAIQNLVASAVPDLEPNRVSVIDHKGVLLAKGAGDESLDSYATTMEEKRLAYERRLREQVESLLERTVGLGKVRAEVAVEMDLDRVTRNSETYDPDGQVVRSTVTVEDRSSELDQDRAQSVSIANNLPDADGAEQGNLLTNSTTNSRVEETVNYEITKVVTTEIHEAGTIERLSVAVLVDGRYSEDAEGNVIYEPRSEDELQKLTALVRTAIGYNAERGDQVEVINMRFADVMGSAPAPIEINIMGFRKDDLFRLAELFVLGLVGVLVIFLVLRPLVTKLVNMPAPTREPAMAGELPANYQAALGGPDEIAGALPPATNEDGTPRIPTDESGRPLSARQIAEKPGGLETAIEVASVESRVQGSAIKKVGELVERHPEEAASVVRGWLYGG